MTGALLEARGLTAGYGQLAAIRDFDLALYGGEIVAVLGPNGAGKTTALLALAGALRPFKGTIIWRGRPSRSPLHVRARNGLSLVMEERSLTRSLSVLDNLRLGGANMKEAFRLFPQLESLSRRSVGLLSGGEQQMLAVARALSRRPAVLLVDELSLGLAPLLADHLAEALRRAADSGVAIVLVEQGLDRALRVSDRYLFLHQGRITLSGMSKDHYEDDQELRAAFFGLTDQPGSPNRPSVPTTADGAIRQSGSASESSDGLRSGFGPSRRA
jgi:branched-chain amino acid transport system ATP-binding protein